MKALVIYDTVGYIWNILYEVEDMPQGIPCIFVDIPNDAQLKHIDVTDKENPKPIFEYLPESDLSRLRKKMKSLETEMTNTQLALTELYEGMEV